MRRWKLALCGSIAVVASFNAMACYTVYDRAGTVVYNGAEAPVDMTRPLHETLPARFPGGHMIFDTATECPNVSLVSTRNLRSDRAPLNSPLLTDAVTAQKMHLPHTIIASGVAVVPAQQVAMRPAITVIPSESTLALARMANREHEATVITELRDGSVDTRVMGGPPAPKKRY